MLEILGNIPKEYILLIDGGKNSIVILDFLSRYDNPFKVVYIDHGNRIKLDYVKRVVKNYKKDLEVVPVRPKLQGEHTVDYNHIIEQEVASKYAPKITVSTKAFIDVIYEYFEGITRCKGSFLPYKTKNIIRPFLKVSETDIAHWIEIKNLGEFDILPPYGEIATINLLYKKSLEMNKRFDYDLLKKISQEFVIFSSNNKKNNNRKGK